MLQGTAPVPGVTFSNNVYDNAGTAAAFATAPAGAPWLTFQQWQAAGEDQAGSSFQDPHLVGVNQFQAAAATFYNTGLSLYDAGNAHPATGSPVIGAGGAQSLFSSSLDGTPFIGANGAWSAGAF